MRAYFNVFFFRIGAQSIDVDIFYIAVNARRSSPIVIIIITGPDRIAYSDPRSVFVITGDIHL